MSRYLPNIITGMRLALTPYLVWLLLHNAYADALLVFVVMGVSDALDGFLAKHFNWQSLLGAYLDPLADKTMLVSAYVALTLQGLIPAWLAALVVARDVVILCGAIAYHWVTRRLEMKPTVVSKANTLFQIVLVLAVISNQLSPLPDGLLPLLTWATLCTTLASGAGYVWEGSRRARRALEES